MRGKKERDSPNLKTETLRAQNARPANTRTIAAKETQICTRFSAKPHVIKAAFNHVEADDTDSYHARRIYGCETMKEGHFLN